MQMFCQKICQKKSSNDYRSSEFNKIIIPLVPVGFEEIVTNLEHAPDRFFITSYSTRFQGIIVK